MNKKFKPFVTLLLIATIFKSVWVDGILNILAIGPWATLGFKALVASIFGFLALHIYAGLAQVIGI